MKKILVPLDFSEESKRALTFAVELAQKASSELVLLHIVEYPVGASVDPTGINYYSLDPALMDVIKKNAQEKMSEVASQRVPTELKVQQLIQMGDPFLGINGAIEDEAVELVVIGSKGATGLKEVLVGSNAEKVIRHARCPVITVKKPVTVAEISNIAFASDFTDGQEDLILKLKQLQHFFHATLHLVKINTPNNFERDTLTKELMRDFASHHMLENYTLNIFNDLYEDEGLIYFAKEIDADMIAIGTHGRTGIAHLMAGSIAEDVANHAKRPIWTYRLKKK